MCPGEIKAKNDLNKINKTNEDEIIKLLLDKKYDPSFIMEFLEPQYQTDKIKRKAAEIGASLKYINNPTYELCCISVSKNGYFLEFVPQKLIDYKMIEIACKSERLAAYTAKYFDPITLTKENYLEIAKHDPFNLLKYKGDNLEDDIIKICLSYKDGAYGIQFLKEKLSCELIEIAINNKPDIKDCIQSSKCFKNVKIFLKNNKTI